LSVISPRLGFVGLRLGSVWLALDLRLALAGALPPGKINRRISSAEQTY